MTVPLNFKVLGQGDPVIILHGFLGALDNWQSFTKALADDFMVITVDQRNHGKSPHIDEFSYEVMVEDLKELMESEWIYEAHIIGHSMGGKTAMHFALNYPDLVEKLIVVDIAPRAYKGGHHEILAALNKIPIHKIQSRLEANKLLAIDIDDPAVRGFLLKNLQRDDQGYRWKFNLKVLTEKYNEILKEVPQEIFSKPTLFVRGERSDYISDNDIEYIPTIFTDSHFKTIKKGGHWVHADQPEALLQAVREFLQ